jgi:hypothetical protein
MSGTDNELMKRIKSGGAQAQQALQVYSSFFEGLKEDRKSLMMGDIMRSTWFRLCCIAVGFPGIKKNDQQFGVRGWITGFCYDRQSYNSCQISQL